MNAMLVAKRHSGMKEWYTGEQRGGQDKAWAGQVLKTVYREALQFHQEQFGPSDEATWLTGKSSLSEVTAVLAQAEERYVAKKANRSKTCARVTSWWQAASSSLMRYEKVIETFVSSHPEYSALVWGAMKFLFTITLNHQQMSLEIAKCFAKIGQELPEVNFIASILYSTDMIQTTLAMIYSQILEFCVRATKWYKEACHSRIKTIFKSITKEWSLEFGDIQSNIDWYCRRLREQSVVAHQAETREMHNKIGRIECILDTSLSLQKGFGSEDMDPLSINITVPIPFVKDRVLPFLTSSSFCPDRSLQIETEFQARRRARLGISPHDGWTSVQVHDWISSPKSSCIQIKAQARNDGSLTDFALGFIQLCKSFQVPIIWFLRSTSMTSTSVSGIDLIRTLVLQIVKQHEAPCAGWKLNEGDFQTCASYEGWLQILVALLREMPKIVVVIDSREDQQAVTRTLRDVQARLTADKVATILKILVTMHRTHGTSVPLQVDGDDAECFQVTLGPLPGFRHGSVPAKALKRRYGSLRSRTGSQPKDLEPFIKDFMK